MDAAATTFKPLNGVRFLHPGRTRTTEKMRCSSALVVLLSLLQCAQALRVPQLSSRRAAIGAIGSAILLPGSAQVRKRPVLHVPALMRVCARRLAD